MPPAPSAHDSIIETDIPARLDALLWSPFHTRVVVALGITWVLDGVEVTLAGALAGAVKESPKLQFTNFDVGLANSAYLFGAALMVAAAYIGGRYALAAERKSLETVARPLAALETV